jgi:hypothetical protein
MTKSVGIHSLMFAVGAHDCSPVSQYVARRTKNSIFFGSEASVCFMSFSCCEIMTIWMYTIDICPVVTEENLFSLLCQLRMRNTERGNMRFEVLTA